MSGNLAKNQSHPYFNQNAVLTTKHHKLGMIAPAFSEVLGLELFDFRADTDLLGTFSGEVDRKLPPKQTAIQKAKIGMRELGIPLGIASEGSVGMDPAMPFANSNTELIVLVDDQRQIEIFESYRSFDIAAIKESVDPKQNLDEILLRAGFPNHKLIASPNQSQNPSFTKGIGSLLELRDSIQKYADLSEDGLALIQSDLRAHCSPTRAQNIRAAASLLAARIARLCSLCDTPGWGKVGSEHGLDCAQCGMFVPNTPRYEVFGCVKCEHTEFGPQLRKKADPATCPHCNP